MKNLLGSLLIFIFALSANAQWIQKTGLPATSRIGPASFVINDIGYIVGGRDANQNYLSDCWAYNPQNDSWTQKAAVPVSGVLAAGGFAINNFGYICCGWNGSIQLANLFKYDPNLNTWATLQQINLPQLSDGLYCCSIISDGLRGNKKLVVIK